MKIDNPLYTISKSGYYKRDNQIMQSKREQLKKEWNHVVIK